MTLIHKQRHLPAEEKKKTSQHITDHILTQEPIMCVQLIYYRVNNS